MAGPGENAGPGAVAQNAVLLRGVPLVGALGDGQAWIYNASSATLVPGVTSGGAPGLHASTHQVGQPDAINVAGLAGKLAGLQYPDNTLIMDPTVGVSAGNVLKTWAEIDAAGLAAPGITEIIFIGACSIPAGGPWDPSRMIWSGALAAGVSTVTIDDGATFTGNPMKFTDSLTVVNDGAASPFGLSSGAGLLFVDASVTLKSNAGKAELFAVTGGATMYTVGGGFSTLGDGTNPAISVDATSTVQLIPLGGAFTLKNSAISGPAGATLNIDRNWPDLQLGNQSGTFSGTIGASGSGAGAVRIWYDKSGDIRISAAENPQAAIKELDAALPNLHVIGGSEHSASALVAWDALLTGDAFEVVSRRGVANGYASLDIGGRIPASQLPLSSLEYKGVWDAATNSPTLADGTGTQGDVWIVTIAGSQDLGSGLISFGIGDWCIHNGTQYQKADNTDAVSSVAGKIGAVLLVEADITFNAAGHDHTGGAAGAKILSFPLGAAEKIHVDAATTQHTGLAGVFDIDVKTSTANHRSVFLTTEIAADVTEIKGFRSDIVGTVAQVAANSHNAYYTELVGHAGDTGPEYIGYKAFANKNGGSSEMIAFEAASGFDYAFLASSGDVQFIDYHAAIRSCRDTVGAGDDLTVHGGDGWDNGGATARDGGDLYLHGGAKDNAGGDGNTILAHTGGAAQGRVGIGTNTPAASALVDMASTTGALLLPRMTTAQKNALTGVAGMLLYDSDLSAFQAYSTDWVTFGPPDVTEVSAIANYNDASTSDKLVTGMTDTPGAGKYLVQSSGRFSNDTANKDTFVSLYGNDVQYAHSERPFDGTATVCCRVFFTSAIITVAAGQAIELRARSESGGNADIDERSMTLMRIH